MSEFEVGDRVYLKKGVNEYGDIWWKHGFRQGVVLKIRKDSDQPIAVRWDEYERYGRPDNHHNCVAGMLDLAIDDHEVEAAIQSIKEVGMMHEEFSPQHSDEEFQREFQRIVTADLVPKVEGSAICVSLVSPQAKVDAKFCTELGVMIMLDKPILAVVLPGAETPEKLKKVADKIVHVDINTEDGRAELARELDIFGRQYAPHEDHEEST